MPHGMLNYKTVSNAWCGCPK